MTNTNNIACFVPKGLISLTEEMKTCLRIIDKTKQAYDKDPNEETLKAWLLALEWFKDVDRRTRRALNLPELEE